MNILIYGDSNTCGYMPNVNGYSKNAKQSFYDNKDVWWFELTKENKVVVNALCGRAINNEHPVFENRNASKTIQKDIGGIRPDLTILMLGTNDLKSLYGESAQNVVNNLKNLIERMEDITYSKEFLVISPPQIVEGTAVTDKHYVGACAKSVELDFLCRHMCRKCGYHFVSGLNLEVGEDGEHLTKNGHKELSKRVCKKVLEIKKTNLQQSKERVQSL